MCTRVEEALCIVALVQAISAKLVRLRLAHRTWPVHRKHMLDENKWRAVRYGIEGKLIDIDRAREVSVWELIERLLAWLDDVVDDLGSRREIEYVHTILSKGTSADRQRAVYRQTGDFRAVVEHVVEETQRNIE
jgi:carboxylate-amine ligase